MSDWVTRAEAIARIILASKQRDVDHLLDAAIAVGAVLSEDKRAGWQAVQVDECEPLPITYIDSEYDERLQPKQWIEEASLNNWLDDFCEVSTQSASPAAEKSRPKRSMEKRDRPAIEAMHRLIAEGMATGPYAAAASYLRADPSRSTPATFDSNVRRLERRYRQVYGE